MHKAAFLDRDGVINYDYGYVHKISDFHIIDGTIEACKSLNEMGFYIIIITNQSGIARGFFDINDLEKIHKYMISSFIKGKVSIKDIIYCPHHPEGEIIKYKKVCNCRKPNPGMIQEAVRKYNVDKKKSFLVGDKISDIETAINSELGCAFKVGDSSELQIKKSKTKIYTFENLSVCVNKIKSGLIPCIF